jgi:hypothetical protein
MKYYRILKEWEADEQELLERQEIKKDCWALSPRCFLSWFLVGWAVITIICLAIGSFLHG